MQLAFNRSIFLKIEKKGKKLSENYETSKDH